MARKVSDLVLLLGSRSKGRGRSRSGFLSGLGRSVTRLFGGSAVADKLVGPANRRVMLPGWLALALALACFGGGYFIGDRFGLTADDPGSGLKASVGPLAPGLIEADTRPLSSQAFFVAAYVDIAVEEARSRAVLLSEYLQARNFPKARPYLCDTEQGPLWCVTVYFSGAAEQRTTAQRLRQLPEDVPCPVFAGLRKQESGWPSAYPVQ